MKDRVAYLVVTEGPYPNKKYAVTQSRTVIGRSEDSDIHLPDQEVSRQHAQIVRDEDGFYIGDLGSTNGTFVNDQRVSGRQLLNNGDVVELGESVSLTFLSLVAEEYDTATYFDVDEFEVEEPVYAEAAPEAPVQMPALPAVDESPVSRVATRSGRTFDRRRWAWGCGCGCLLLVLLCAASLFFLDAYDGGKLLYCGPLQGLFELVLGPVGFSPACAIP